MTSRKSSGSMRAESAVEPTRSAEHHRDLAAFGSVVGRAIDCRRLSAGSCFRICARAQSSDGVEQLAAMPDDDDTQVLQVLRRQARQDRLVDCVLAECCLILFEAKAPQPTSKVHDGALTPADAHDRPGETTCPVRVLAMSKFGDAETKEHGPDVRFTSMNRCQPGAYGVSPVP